MPAHILIAVLAICCASLAAADPAAPAAATSTTPIILLKLDDLRRITPQWKRCTEFLAAEQVKASYGILCDALETSDPTFEAWVKDLHDKGQIEFWSHGYTTKVVEDKDKGTKGDWVGTGYDYQLKTMLRCQELFQQRFGFPFAAFGPHTYQVDDDTWKAMEQLPALKAVWSFAPKDPKQTSKFLIVRRGELNVEQPLFVPNPEALQKAFEAKGRSLEYISLQGHPNQWDDKRFEAFKTLVLYLKAQGCRFMGPSEFLAQRK